MSGEYDDVLTNHPVVIDNVGHYFFIRSSLGSNNIL